MEMIPASLINTEPYQHTQTYIYIYIYICVCVCMYIGGIQKPCRQEEGVVKCQSYFISLFKQDCPLRGGGGQK